MSNWTIKIFLISSLVFIGAFSFVGFARAALPVDFGGKVVMIKYCYNGIAVTIQFPNSQTMKYFYVPGLSAIKPYGPPVKDNQIVLGKAFDEPMICFFGCGDGTCSVDGGFLVTPNAGSVRP